MELHVSWCKDKEGLSISSKLGILARWARYFDRLLNSVSELITEHVEGVEEAVAYAEEDNPSR